MPSLLAVDVLTVLLPELTSIPVTAMDTAGNAGVHAVCGHTASAQEAPRCPVIDYLLQCTVEGQSTALACLGWKLSRHGTDRVEPEGSNEVLTHLPGQAVEHFLPWVEDRSGIPLDVCDPAGQPHLFKLKWAP